MTDGSGDARPLRAKDLEGETVKVLFRTPIARQVNDPLLLGSYDGNQCFLRARQDTSTAARDRHLEKDTQLRIGAVREEFAMIGGLGRTEVVLPLDGGGVDIACTFPHTRADSVIDAEQALMFIGPRFQVGARPPARDYTAYHPSDQPRE